MNYINDFRELIGNTPLLKLNHMGYPQQVSVFAKLELMNPGGSVKDRMGMAMLADAERSGRLKPGGTIIEATAGNAGIGIALAALNRGYRVIFTVPEKFSIEKQRIMIAYGAEIVHTPKELGMQGAVAKAAELLKTTDNSITLLADPIGSTMGGGEAGCYAIEGIGNTFMPETMDISLVDEVIKVDDDGAFEEVRLLARREGVLAGSSSGAALQAARKLAESGVAGNIVVILPDRGDRYFSKNLI